MKKIYSNLRMYILHCTLSTYSRSSLYCHICNEFWLIFIRLRGGFLKTSENTTTQQLINRKSFKLLISISHGFLSMTITFTYFASRILQDQAQQVSRTLFVVVCYSLHLKSHQNSRKSWIFLETSPTHHRTFYSVLAV